MSVVYTSSRPIPMIWFSEDLFEVIPYRSPQRVGIWGPYSIVRLSVVVEAAARVNVR
jgi:hypothetical protein